VHGAEVTIVSSSSVILLSDIAESGKLPNSEAARKEKNISRIYWPLGRHCRPSELNYGYELR